VGPCAICARSIEGGVFTDATTGDVFHPACVVRRAPEDAAIALFGLLALVVAPLTVVWAG
jgi:hypothetical protein